MEVNVKEFQEKMEKTISVLQGEYATIRAGRANPHVLDKIKVNYYGTPTPIQQVGNISVPEARVMVIQLGKGTFKGDRKSCKYVRSGYTSYK